MVVGFCPDERGTTALEKDTTIIENKIGIRIASLRYFGEKRLFFEADNTQGHVRERKIPVQIF
jgi:hypothetical protein